MFFHQTKKFFGADTRWRWRVCLLVLAPMTSSAVGQEVPQHCFVEASERFPVVSPGVLRALAQQESAGRCTRRHPPNVDGSYDIGCTGINSSWLPSLHRKFGFTEQDLYDPCTNVHVAAWIYAKNVVKFGNTWQALGAFNARSEDKRITYAWKIYRHLNPTR